MSENLRVGFLINPLAGIGGSLALKGSDSIQARKIATEQGSSFERRAQQRAERTLQTLAAQASLFHFYCWSGAMGEDSLKAAKLSHSVIGGSQSELTSAKDTKTAVSQMLKQGLDVILFAGGDGTARDIFDMVGKRCPVIAIPTGVKMHSGVFAVSPEAAGELLLKIAKGGLVGLQAREVRDIDEEAFQRDIVRSRFYGELMVPGDGDYLQHTKIGGREDPELSAADIASWIVESMQPARLYAIGPGSTTAAIMAELDLPNTLLGVDVVCDNTLLASDVDETLLLSLMKNSEQDATIVATVIGGQGYLFGRGNQQFSPAVIRQVGLDNITIVAAKSKLSGLEGRPLLVDTNDTELDAQLSGLRTVITGYDDQVLYRVGQGLE